MCVKWKVSQRLHIMMCPFLRMWNPCILARPARPALSLPSREEALLTSLLFWPQAPKIRLGQTAMTKDEGFEEALFYQPPFLATGTHPSPVLESAEAWRKRLQAPSSFAGSETKLAWYFCPISLIPETLSFQPIHVVSIWQMCEIVKVWFENALSQSLCRAASGVSKILPSPKFH